MGLKTVVELMKNIHLKNASRELDAVLNGGIEGIYDCGGTVSLPVSLINLLPKEKYLNIIFDQKYY